MGNWRTVHIVGTCDRDDLPLLQKLTADHPDRFHCLTVYRSLCGLGDWPAEQIDRTGNLSERDYSVEDVRETFAHLAFACPSLDLWVHCGDERESEVCVASIRVWQGRAWSNPPEVETVGRMSKEQARANMLAMMRQA